MKLIKEVRQVGTGFPVPSASVFVYSWPEGLGVGAIPTDADGLGVIVVQGAPGAVVVHAERGAATYDDYSESIQPAGQFDLDMLRTRLANIITDGIVATYGNVFRLTVGSGSITLSSGGVVLDGILALFAISTTIPVTNGDRAVVAVLSGDAVSLAEIAYSAIVAGTHVPLYRYTVSAGSVVTSSITDIGRLAGPRAGRKSQIGIARLASGSTLNNSGEVATGLSVTLELEAATYDVQARVTAVGRGRDGALMLEMGSGFYGTYRSLNGDIKARLTNSESRTGVVGPGSMVIQAWERRDTSLVASQWALQATYGPTFNGVPMSNPNQVAIDSAGRVLIADTGNDRLVILTSAGAYSTSIPGLTGITGVCVDTTGDIYVAYFATAFGPRVSKYRGTDLVLLWSRTVTMGAGHAFTHVAAGAGLVWATASDGAIRRMDASTGALLANLGSFGSSDGYFSNPWGITTDGTYFWVIDGGNARIQKFTNAGSFVSKFDGINVRTRGCALDGSGNLLSVVDTFADLGFGWIQTISASTFTGFGALFYPDQPYGVAVAPGNVIWVTDWNDDTVSKWDEVVSALAFEYDAALLTAIAIPR